jgi:hypothetical protein
MRSNGTGLKQPNQKKQRFRNLWREQSLEGPPTTNVRMHCSMCMHDNMYSSGFRTSSLAAFLTHPALPQRIIPDYRFFFSAYNTPKIAWAWQLHADGYATY